MNKLINLMSQNAISHPGGCLCDSGYFDPNILHNTFAFASMLLIILLTPMLIKLLWNNGEKFETYHRLRRNKRDFIVTIIILTPIFLLLSWFISYIVIFGIIGVLLFQIVDFFTYKKHIIIYSKIKGSKLFTKKHNDISQTNKIKAYKESLLKE